MTVLDDTPRTTRRAAWTPRLHRRHEIVSTGGMGGVLRVGAALASCGYAVRDFAVDVREGISHSSITCTVALTKDETVDFAERLVSLPEVVSVHPC